MLTASEEEKTASVGGRFGRAIRVLPQSNIGPFVRRSDGAFALAFLPPSAEEGRATRAPALDRAGLPGRREPSFLGSMTETVVLWTGGKDSTLALHETLDQGRRVDRLVTFVPRKERFLAHPSSLIALQAAALGIDHVKVEIEPPFERGYDRALAQLRSEGVDTLITGDIARVGGHENWIRSRAESAGISVVQPLWERSRAEVLAALHQHRLAAVITYVRDPRLGSSWVGRRLDRSACDQLLRLQEVTGLDACGEEGEYHTMVLDSPRFREPIDLPRLSTRAVADGWYLVIDPDPL